MKMQKNNSNIVSVVILLLILLTTIFVWVTVIYEKDKYLTVTFLDVGQGDSIFIESSSGSQVLIDGGRSGSVVLRELTHVMPFFDRSIDVVIATHPDADHIGGLLSVLKRYRVDTIMRPGVGANTPASESLLKIVAGKHTKEILARRGQVLDLGNGVHLDILFPDRNVSDFDPNVASVVARLVYGDTSFLLTGDSPDEIEKYLVDLDGKKLKSTILKLGHHGSKTSSSRVFLGFVSPEYAIVSAGKDNSYGHPHKIILDRLNTLGIQYLETSKDGRIIFKSDGKKVKRMY